MRIVSRDPNITDEDRARRRARMAERATLMRPRDAQDDEADRLAVKLAASLEHVGPPMTVVEFEAEWDRRDALAAAERVPKTD